MDVIALGAFLVLVVAWIILPVRTPVIPAEQQKKAA